MFFEDGDYALYLDLLAEAAERRREWRSGYCLMTNHVHIIATPGDEDETASHLRYVHRHYAGYINARMRVTGHLWQGRYRVRSRWTRAHLVCALRLSLSPVRARLVERNSSARCTGSCFNDIPPQRNRIAEC